MRVRNTLFKLMLLTASLAAVLVAGELCVRALQSLGVLSSGDSALFPAVPYAGKFRRSANATLLFELDPSDPLINADGFRDRDYPIAKGEAWRIMALGDSVTFGRGVPLEDTYAKVLERLLNDENQAGKRFEVMNVAVGGYNSLQELELYRTVGRKYQPDLLIVGFVLNDCHPPSVLMGHWGNLKEKRERAAGSARERPAAVPSQSPPEAFLSRSRLVERLRPLLDRRREERPGAPLWVAKQCRIPQNWDIVRNAFRELAELRASDGTRVVIAIIPMLVDFESYPFAALHQRVKREARAHGLNVVDLFSAFAARDAEGLRDTPADTVHLNETGHRVAAQRLHEYLIEYDVVPH